MRKCDWCGNPFDGSYWYHQEEGKLPKGYFCSPKCEIQARDRCVEGSPHALETAANVAVGVVKLVVGAAAIAAGLFEARAEALRCRRTATAGRRTPSRRVAATGGAAAARGGAAS